MMKICKTYRFEAAHKLKDHDGLCAELHGHSYRVEIEVTGLMQSTPGTSDYQMVMDFKDLDAIVEPLIASFDHSYLNSAIGLIREFSGCGPPLARTTAEELAAFFGGEIMPLITNLSIGRRLSRVRLWETEKSYAEWTP